MQADLQRRLSRRPVRPRTVALAFLAFLCLTLLFSNLLSRAVDPIGDAVIAKIQSRNAPSVRVAEKSLP